MGRDLLTETIAATADYDVVNVEGADAMSYPPSYSAGSCPEAVGEITVNETIIEIGGTAGRMKVDVFTGLTGLVATLTYEPITAYPCECTINGVTQAYGTDFTISGDVATHLVAFNAEDKVVYRYAYEV